jgi:hypothetical protein
VGVCGFTAGAQELSIPSGVGVCGFTAGAQELSIPSVLECQSPELSSALHPRLTCTPSPAPPAAASSCKSSAAKAPTSFSASASSAAPDGSAAAALIHASASFPRLGRLRAWWKHVQPSRPRICISAYVYVRVRKCKFASAPLGDRHIRMTVLSGWNNARFVHSIPVLGSAQVASRPGCRPPRRKSPAAPWRPPSTRAPPLPSALSLPHHSAAMPLRHAEAAAAAQLNLLPSAARWNHPAKTQQKLQLLTSA